MATNLTDIIKKVRTALRGEEVRGSIADGLEFCGQISENAKADMEATAASTKEQLSKDIDAKAAETLKSIPESYTELDGSVKQLREDIINSENILICKKGKMIIRIEDVELGDIDDTTGQNINSNNSYRTTKYYPLRELKDITVPSGYIVKISMYNSNMKLEYFRNIPSTVGLVKLDGLYEYIRFVIFKSSYKEFEINQDILKLININFTLLNTDNALLVYNSVNDMKNDTSLREGNMCITNGYYSEFDGGGSKYIITLKKVDDLFSLPLSNGLFATMEDTDTINVLTLGVKRNVNSDESDRTQYIINSLSKRHTLYFPSGLYTFQKPIKFINRHNLKGENVSPFEIDKNINGTRLYFINIASGKTLLDFTENYRCTISNIYVISDAVAITEDRSLIGTDGSGKSCYNIAYNHTGQIAINLGSYGFNVENVVIRGVSYGINGHTWNVFNNIYFYSCMSSLTLDNDNVASNIRATNCAHFIKMRNLNLIVNARCDGIVEEAITINGNGNNLTNINLDFVQYNAITIGGERNCIQGMASRCGTYYNGALSLDDKEKHKSTYIYLNNANSNSVKICCKKINPLDEASKYLTPLYTIVAENTNKNNSISLYGDYDGLSNNNLLTKSQLNNLYNIISGENIAYLQYHGDIYTLDNENVYVTQRSPID